MTWRDNLRTASFRGAVFKVRETDSQFGRRNVLHQYPNKDVPYLEDLGLDADQFRVTGYVIQNVTNEFDYYAERDALIGALKQKGPGTLVHPFMGEFQVGVVGKASIRESFDQGGIAVFDINFVLAGQTEFPKDIFDVEGFLDVIAGEVQSDALTSFLEKYEVAGAVDYILNSALSDAQGLTTMIINNVSALSRKISGTAAEVLSGLYSIKADLVNFYNAPVNLAEQLESAYDAFTDLLGITGDFTYPEARYSLFSRDCASSASDTSSYGDDLDTITVSTSNRAIQYRNRAAVVNYGRALALSTASIIAVRAEYDSADDAEAMRDEIVADIDAQLLKLGDEVDDSAFTDYSEIVFDNSRDYQALQKLRASLFFAMSEIGADLAKVVDYEVPGTVIPTLVVAYDKYKDIDREGEILDRNVRLMDHPGFLPEGQRVSILSK